MSESVDPVTHSVEEGRAEEDPVAANESVVKTTSDMHPDPGTTAPAAAVKDETLKMSEFGGGVEARLKKRKCAIFLVYLGHKYQGMQRNPGVKSIEDELFQAMCKAGAISELNASGEMAYQKIHWSRAARTDKGVSAICQVVSSMLIALDGVVDSINEHLPDDIRILGYRRTVKGFDARKACDRRRYEYILPEWMFDPSLQPTSKEQTSGLSTEQFLARRNPDYVFDDADMARMTGILAQYEGTHNFHNYTVRVKACAPQAKRFMLSFKCEGVTEIKGQRWVRMAVVGQSFMLHQIRKMIGMAVAVFRDMAPESALKHALRSREREGVPIAPDLGLFLDRSYFESYNKQWGHQHGCLDSDEMYGDQIQAFKLEKLYPSLVERDQAEQCNASWIQEMYAKRISYFHRYPGFVQQGWDVVFQPECAKRNDGGDMDANVDQVEGFQRNGGSKRPLTAGDATSVGNAGQKPTPNKRAMIDISAEYSD